MRTLWAVIAVVVLTLVAGVGALWVWAQGSPAEARTHARAVAIFNAMETYPGKTAYDQAREGARRGEVEILVATDRPADGRRIVLAITAHHECRTNWECATRIWPDSSNTYSATRCFEWSQSREWGTAEEVDCPRTPEIDTTPAGTVGLPDDAEARLEAALRANDAAASVRALTDLPGLEMREEGTRIYVASGGITGYWTGRMATDCLLGWKVDGTVDVVRLSSSPHEEPLSCGWEAARARADG
ncbi:hypothetical protein ACFV9G_28320 [Nocardioides sp. NPDC059952]|uniref:hypothetical protein n=1 Tax=Nocardioides sp. NPDC059952 TaxID=3347014 RepID=UPI003651D606